jgi:hypothetical protein
MLDQSLSLFGAALVLGAFAANLHNRLANTSILYALLNTVGSGVLSWVAIRSSPVGIITIEVSWTLISGLALVRALRARSVRHRSDSTPFNGG